MIQYPKVAMENSFIAETNGMLSNDDNAPSESVQMVNYTKTRACKRPSVYNLDSKIKFKHWLAAFKNFASATKIKDEDLIDSMLTFLSPESLRRVEALGLDAEDKANVELSIGKISKALSNVNAASMAKAKLLRSKQKKNQSITDFATKLMDLAIDAYPEKSNEAIRNEILMDVFLANMRSEYIALGVLREQPTEFRQALDSALRLEAIMAKRGDGNIPNDEEEEETVLAMDDQEYIDMSTIQCLRCGEIGHYEDECISNIDDLLEDVNFQSDYVGQTIERTQSWIDSDNNEDYHECYDHGRYEENEWTYNDRSYDQFDMLQDETWQPEADYMTDYSNYDSQFPQPDRY